MTGWKPVEPVLFTAAHKSPRVLRNNPGRAPSGHASRDLWSNRAMPRADRIDLMNTDIATLPLPLRGEVIIRDSANPALGLRLRSSGARTWVLFAKRAGRTTRETLGNACHIPLAAARRMADQPAIDAPLPSFSAPLFGSDARISEVWPHFLAVGEAGRWKPGTIRNMRSIADQHILPLLGGMKVRDLTSEQVAQWHLDVAARSTAIRMALSTLSGLMLYAEDHGLREAGSNPCRGLSKKWRGRRGLLLPAATIRALWAALDRLQTRMPDACDAVRLLLLTGARRSEILSLEWDWIVGSRAVLKDSKEGPRTIWLNVPARAILDARKGSSSSPFVFPAPKGNGPVKVIDRAWAAIRTEAGIGRLRVHDLRHHFASIAVSNSIDLHIVGQVLGHHEIDSTLGYAHLASDALMKSATRVSKVIDRSMRSLTAVHGKRRQPASPVSGERHG